MRQDNNDRNIVFPFGAFNYAFTCEKCGHPAEVMSIYGEHEECYCASCYVREHLPKITVTFGKKADFNGACVGSSYVIGSYGIPEELQD